MCNHEMYFRKVIRKVQGPKILVIRPVVVVVVVVRIRRNRVNVIIRAIRLCVVVVARRVAGVTHGAKGSKVGDMGALRRVRGVWLSYCHITGGLHDQVQTEKDMQGRAA